MANITEYIIKVTDKGTATMDKLTGANEKLTGSFKNLGGGLSEVTNKMPVVGSAFGAAINPAAALASVVVGLGVAYVGAVKKSLDWNKQMAEINVTAELSKDKLMSLSKELREIGGRNVKPLEEIPTAFNRIISAGLSVNQSLETLEPTLRAAKAGFTDVETVAGAAVSTMMASGESAAKVYDILFETVKEGNAEFKDIANYLPKIIPLARNVGFALDETAGAFASLTGKLSVEQSTTALQGIMRSLSNPKVTKEFEKLGIKIFDNKGVTRSLLDIIKDTEQKMSGLNDRSRLKMFDKLGLDQMSTTGFSTLLQNVESLEKAIDATTNSTGALNKAYSDSLTPLDSWQILQNKIKVKMLQIGDTALPIITEIGNKILGVVEYFEDLYDNSVLFQDVIKGVGFVLKNVFLLPFKMISQTIDLIQGLGSDLEWLAEKAGITGLEFSSIGDFAESMYLKAKPYLLYMYEMFEKIAFIGKSLVSLNFGEAWKAVKGFKLPDINAIQNRVLNDKNKKFGAEFSNPDKTGNKAGNYSGVEKGITSATKGGTRNISITFGKFQDKTEIHVNEAKESIDEIVKMVTEAMTRGLAIAQSSSR